MSKKDLNLVHPLTVIVYLMQTKREINNDRVWLVQIAFSLFLTDSSDVGDER